MADKSFEQALFAAFDRLQQLKEQERSIAVEKSQLNKTIEALFPLVFPDQIDINSLSLPNAIRMVVSGAGGRPISPAEMKGKLEDLGYDISKYDNPLANIHTAMNRMVEAEEMVWADINGKKKALPGPELKPVPQPQPELPITVDRASQAINGDTLPDIFEQDKR
jgi:hypothetical protein